MPISTSSIERLWAFIMALVLGYFFIVVQAQEAWKTYWLVKDGRQGTAVVTKELWTGHDAVGYQYRVNEQEYTGQDARSYQYPKRARVMVGEHTVVYFSSSHPWLSALNRPSSAIPGGLPVLILVWLIEAGLILTVAKPKSRWAFRFTTRK